MYISIQIFAPIIFFITSKNRTFVVLLSIENCNLGFTWLKIVSKSLDSINLVLRRISQLSKNRNQFSLKNYSLLNYKLTSSPLYSKFFNDEINLSFVIDHCYVCISKREDSSHCCPLKLLKELRIKS